MRLVKAMVFPVVMYGCESWIISWARKNWCFWTVVLEKTLESPLDCKEIQPVYPKGNQFGHLIWRAYSLEKTLMLGKMEGRSSRGWQRMRRLGSITDSMDMSLSLPLELAMDMEGWHASVHGIAESWTWLSDWTDWTECFPVILPHFSSPVTLLFSLMNTSFFSSIIKFPTFPSPNCMISWWPCFIPCRENRGN